MIFIWIAGSLAVLLLVSYSVLRYHHLWNRYHLPDIPYFVIQAFFILLALLCGIKASWIPNEAVRNVLQAVSAVYASVMLYTPVFCFFRGIVRFVGKRMKNKGRVFRFFNHPSKSIYCIFFLTALIGVVSFCRMRYVVVTDYQVSVRKPAETEEMKIVFLSDPGLGSTMTKESFAGLVSRINRCEPDLVILCGDILDRNVSGPLKSYAAEHLQDLSATYGVFYVEGNKELRMGEDFAAWFENIGITVLNDRTAHLANGVQLVGLRDLSDPEKLPPETVMQGVDRERPVVVASHRPKELKKLSAAGGDLVCCGHTLGGQYPLGSLAVRAVNDMNYGIKEYGAMRAITTSGAGGCGIASKLTAPSEIVLIRVSFEG